MKKFLGIVFLFFIFSNISFANNLKVSDGDTIILNGEKIRFSGIDTPELKQTCIKNENGIYWLFHCGKFVKDILVKKIGNNIINCERSPKKIFLVEDILGQI